MNILESIIIITKSNVILYMSHICLKGIPLVEQLCIVKAYCIGGHDVLLQLALKKRKIAVHFCFLIKPSIFYMPFESDTA